MLTVSRVFGYESGGGYIGTKWGILWHKGVVCFTAVLFLGTFVREYQWNSYKSRGKQSKGHLEILLPTSRIGLVYLRIRSIFRSLMKAMLENLTGASWLKNITLCLGKKFSRRELKLATLPLKAKFSEGQFKRMLF